MPIWPIPFHRVSRRPSGNSCIAAISNGNTRQGGRRAIAELSAKLGAATDEAERAKSELAENAEFIQQLFTENSVFKLEEGKLKLFGSAAMVLSLTDTYYHGVKLYLDNKSHDVALGNYLSVDLDGRACKLIVEQVSINPDTASFRLLCPKPPNPALDRTRADEARHGEAPVGAGRSTPDR